MNYKKQEILEELQYWSRELEICESDLFDQELIEKVGIKFIKQCHAMAEQRVKHYQNLYDRF